MSIETSVKLNNKVFGGGGVGSSGVSDDDGYGYGCGWNGCCDGCCGGCGGGPIWNLTDQLVPYPPIIFNILLTEISWYMTSYDEPFHNHLWNDLLVQN